MSNSPPPLSTGSKPSRTPSSRRGAGHASADVLRRVPQQARGRERVERILDAAAVVIAEVGVTAATTNAIATQARTSVGSLYQFFPNKEAIVEALAVRYNEELRRINEAALPIESAFLPLPELLEHVVTPLLHFHQGNPAYRHVYHAVHHPEGITTSEAMLHKAVVTRVEAILQMRAPLMSAEARHLHATVAVLTVHALLSYAMTASATMLQGIVYEVKRLMVLYLDAVIELTSSALPAPEQFLGTPTLVLRASKMNSAS